MLRILRSQVSVFLLINSASLFAYLFQAVLARVLTTAEFGSFNGLFSIALWLAACSSTIQFVIAKQTVILSFKGEGAISALLRRSLLVMAAAAVLTMVVGAGLTPALTAYLNETDGRAVFLTILMVASMLLYPVVMGVLQGLRRFLALAIGLSSLGFFRLVGGVLLVGGLRLGVEGALWACTLSSFGGLACGLFGARDVAKPTHERLPPGLVRAMWNDGWPILITTAFVTALGNIDIVMARHYLEADNAGFYATAGVVGRIAMLLPSALVNLLFPHAVHASQTRRDDRMALALNLTAMALLGGGVALGCGLFPDLVLRILMGPGHAAAAPVLRYYAVAMALLAVANGLFTYCLARSEYGFLVPLVAGVAGFLAALAVWHDSAVTIARLLLSATAVIFASSAVWFLWLRRPTLIEVR